MTIPAAQDPSLGFVPGDHVCAFYSSSRNLLDDIPHFFFCLYDLDVFDGDTVMHVLRTHPRVYVNGIVIGNPHYQADRLPG